MNVSEKAWGYELSVSGWVPRVDVHDWSEADYSATDTVIGGTYNGETVNTVFNPEGKFFAIEGTRESGVTAKTFETGYDTHLGQSHRHVQGFVPYATGRYGNTATGINNSWYDTGGGSSASGNGANVSDPIADGVNGTPLVGLENRPEYYTGRAWVRLT
jgi:hypothetical protein